ncbi:TetR/AcrR family transcriptional regulator [Sinomonas sp. JGH33]|uniref:TetR/AcrR family transcriptional regulator n=1 Tax=Sinomonas terricola TaxID=3110330 RepID=A0ABU5TAC6_9MICC|nr:TetR/AcrR family transcriptional regulator [Sinomonas sp. JGH33]MEA5456624.1 TetR/AcrR family transcriptional regulator [Sinomonas sp. JGH33]
MISPLDAPSRRELNKAATRQSIILAAVDLARERGLGNFTAEDLAEAAGVSRRTFFNYFSSADEAIAAPTFGFLDAALDRFRERPPGEPLLESAINALVGLADHELMAPMAQSFIVAHGHDPVTRFQLQAFDECSEKIVAAIRKREGDSLDELYVQALAGSVMACGKASLQVWFAERGGDLSPSSIDRLRELLMASIAHLKCGFAVP